MMRCFCLLFTLFIGSGVLAEGHLYTARAAVPFTLDGDYEENIYCGYPWSEAFHVLDCESETVNGLYAPPEKEYLDLKTFVGSFVHGEDFVVAFRCPASSRTAVGDTDAVGAALSPDGKNLVVVTCDSTGGVKVAKVDMAGKRSVVAAHGVKAGVKASKGFLGVELAIPFSLFGVTAKTAGRAWKANFFRTGPSCGGRASWASVSAQSDMLELDRFGEVLFEKGERDIGKTLPENARKSAFIWEGTRWGWTPGDRAPLDQKELPGISLAAPLGARAIAHFRMNNLTDTAQMWTLQTDNYDKNEFAKRVRFREMAKMELKGGPVINDPIFDLPNGWVLRIPAHSMAMVWVDVETAGLKPGKHMAKLVLHPCIRPAEKNLEYVEKTLSLELVVGKADISTIDIPCWSYAIRWPQEYRALKDYRFNVICMGPFQYNVVKDGKRDWTNFDEAIEAVMETGVKQSEVRILFYHLFPHWCNKKTYRTPKFEEEIVTSLREAIKYAKERWGIGYDRLMWSARDEPHGDVTDPESGFGHALYGVQLARRADPQLRNFTNPWKLDKAEDIKAYLDNFEVLEPYQARMDDAGKGAAAIYAKSGRELWSYVILLKQNTSNQYRHANWAHIAWGFKGPATFYDLHDCAGNPYDSYDRNGGPDYNGAYRNRRTGASAPSRRLEAWFQGYQELKLALWCRRAIDALEKKGAAAEAKAFRLRLDEIAQAGMAPRADFDQLAGQLFSLSEDLAK